MDSPTERDSLPNGASQRPSVPPPSDEGSAELRGALVAGIIGAVVATAGFVIYNRLEEDHREALRRSVTKFVEERVAEVRSQLKF